MKSRDIKYKKAVFLLLIPVVLFLIFSIISSKSSPNIDHENGTDINEVKFEDGESRKIKRAKGFSVPEIEAKAIYSFYYENGEKEILFSRNRNEQLPIASITKLITAMIVYDRYELSELVGLSESRLINDSNLRDLRIFSNTTYYDLLYPLLLESNNSSAYVAAIASNDIDFDKFIEIMNKKAEKMGMRRTIYHNPSGLDSLRGVNKSTAKDIGILIKEILDIPLFWEIMQEDSYRIYSAQSTLYYNVETTNQFLDGRHFNQSDIPDWHDKIIGGKTGFTTRAGGCLVMVLKVGDGYLVNIILGAEGHNERFEEMEKLIDWLFEAYKF